PDPRGLRRGAAHRARPRPARGRRAVAGRGRPDGRLRQRRGAAPRVSPPCGRLARRVPRALSTRGLIPRPRRSTMFDSTHSKRRFARHYVEMVVVMFAGMVVLGAPAGWLMGAMGTSWSRLSPALMVFAMAVTMTLPMVAWMRFRGHAWRPTNEMAASMFIPAFVAMALVWTGVATGTGTLMVFE